MSIDKFDYYTHQSLTLHQSKMIELLSFFSDVCRTHSIDYWLDGGSLLGLVRHNELIPWDDDIDICVPVKDYYRMIEVLDELSRNNEYYLYYKSKGLSSWSEYLCLSDWFCEYTSGFIKPVRIDLIPVKDIERGCLSKDEDKVEKIHQILVRKDHELNRQEISSELKAYNTYMANSQSDRTDVLLVKGHGQYSPIKHVDKNIVYPLIQRNFMGVQVLVPNDIDKYLIKSYGNNFMSLPKLESRRPMSIDCYESNAIRSKVDNFLIFDFYSRKGNFLSRNLTKYFHLLREFGMTHVMKVIKNKIIKRQLALETYDAKK